MNQRLQLALVFLTLGIACVSCASSPPQNAQPGRLSVVADTNSPYWKSLVDRFIPWGINGNADFKIVAPTSTDAPFKLVIKIVNEDRYLGGIKANAYGAKANMVTRLEVAAALLDASNLTVWGWTGWAEQPTGEHAMKQIAKQLGKEMKRQGLLEPSYYTQPKGSIDTFLLSPLYPSLAYTPSHIQRGKP